MNAPLPPGKMLGDDDLLERLAEAAKLISTQAYMDACAAGRYPPRVCSAFMDLSNAAGVLAMRASHLSELLAESEPRKGNQS